MLIGCGRSEILFPNDFFPTEGFTKLAHPLYVRTLLLGKDAPILLVSIEMTSLPDDDIAFLRKTTAEQVETHVQNIWIMVTHTFSAPHILPDHLMKTSADQEHRSKLQKALWDAVCAAVSQAKDNLQVASLDIWHGESAVSASRDIELPEGWWVGCNGAGDSDRTLTVLKATCDEKTKLILFHLNVQSSVLDQTGAENGKCVSGDLAGIACAELEKRYPGATAFFIIGAAGDQAPIRRAAGYIPDGQGFYPEVDLHEAGIVIAEELGEMLADEVQSLLSSKGKPIHGNAKITNASVTVQTKKMNRNLHELMPTHSCDWEMEGESQQPISLLTLGSLAIVGVKPELTYATNHQIKVHSPFAYTLVATLVNGGAKYMAEQSAYDKVMYEAMNSPFAPGSAERMAKKAVQILHEASKS